MGSMGVREALAAYQISKIPSYFSLLKWGSEFCKVDSAEGGNKVIP